MLQPYPNPSCYNAAMTDERETPEESQLIDSNLSNREQFGELQRTPAYRLFLKAIEYEEVRGASILLSIVGGPFLLIVGMTCFVFALFGLFSGLFSTSEMSPFLRLAGLGAVAAIAGAAICIWAYARIRKALRGRDEEH